MAVFETEKKLKDGSLVAVFDIASASVGGLLLRHRKKGLPEILVSTRLSADFPSDASFAVIWRSLHKAFLSVTEYLKKSVPEKPEYAFCVFSSPWYIFKTKIIRVSRKNPFKVDENFLNQLIRDEADIFKRRWQESALGEKGEAVFIEQEPVKTTLNGYLIKSPLGKTAHRMELTVYFSMGLSVMEQKIKEDILRFIKPQMIFFSTFPFVAFKILKHVINTREGLILTDITRELTDVFLIRDNIPEEVNSFNKGENFLARRLASVFNMEFSEAKSLLSQYERGDLEPGYSFRVGETMEAASGEWFNHLRKMLMSMAEERLLPQNFYFCGPAGSLKEISQRVLNEELAKYTVLNKPFNVGFLLPESFRHHFDFPKGFSNSKDILLLTSALYASVYFN